MNIAKTCNKQGDKMARVKHPPYRVDRRNHGNIIGSIDHPSVILIHATQSGDRDGASDVRGVLEFLESTKKEPATGGGYGIHRVIDKEGIIGRGAKLHAPGNKVQHATGANSIAVGIELIAWSRFNLAKWLTRRRQLQALAWEMAFMSQELGIPLRRSKTHGVAMHREFPLGGHTDPGSFFPINRVIRMARWNVKRAARGKSYGFNTPLNPVL